MRDEHVEKLAYDADELFKHIVTNFGRDPEQDKQEWTFVVESSNCIDDNLVKSAIEQVELITAEQESDGPPRTDVYGREGFDGEKEDSTLWLTYKGTMTLDQLKTLHQYFDLLTDGYPQHYYDGVVCIGIDYATNAAELFRYWRKSLLLEPSQCRLSWWFDFSSFSVISNERLQQLMDVIYKTVKSSGEIKGRTIFGDGDENDHLAIVVFEGKLFEGQLVELHRNLRQFAKNAALKYLGASCWDDMSQDFLRGDSEPDRQPDNQDRSPAATETLPDEDDDDTVEDIQFVEELELLDDEESIPLADSDSVVPGLAQSSRPFESLNSGADWVSALINETGDWEFERLVYHEMTMRKAHLSALKKQGLVAADWMPVVSGRFEFSESGVPLRDQKTVIKRLLALNAVSAWVCAPEEVVNQAQLGAYLKRNQLKKADFSKQETDWLQSRRESVREHSGLAGWLTEHMWSLAWMLGYEIAPSPSPQMASDDVLGIIHQQWLNRLENGLEELTKRTKLRPIEQIITLEDLLYCAHNAARSQWINNNDPDAKLQVALIGARRISLTWAMSPTTAWDETDVST